MKRGFTLIEILVAISILAVLASIAIFGLNNASSSARDAKRKSDLESVKVALELFFNDCGHYPLPSSNSVPENINSGLSNVDSVNCPDTPNEVVYMSETPKDPLESEGAFYYYARPNPQSYVLCSHLEGNEDVVATGCASSCGLGSCNYKVSGP